MNNYCKSEAKLRHAEPNGREPCRAGPGRANPAKLSQAGRTMPDQAMPDARLGRAGRAGREWLKPARPGAARRSACSGTAPLSIAVWLGSASLSLGDILLHIYALLHIIIESAKIKYNTIS